MSHFLPKAPNLEQLRKQAKDLVKAHRSRDKDACGILRHLRQFDRASDEDILGAEVSLHDTQRAIAKEYGFEGWSQLKRHVEQAASASKAPSVRRENGRVWIEGVPELRWGQSGECTFAGALAAALFVTPHPVSYADLMGYSGLAFRVRWYRRFDQADWCPSSPVGEFSEEIRTVAGAIGWHVDQESQMGKDQPQMNYAAPALRESIEDGRPVVGYPDSVLDVGVAYGYEEAEGRTTFLWNAYGRSGLRVPAEKVGPWLMFLRTRGKPMGPRAALMQALTTPNWRRKRLDPFQPKPGQDAAYLYGFDALRQWRNDIGQAEEFPPEQRKNLFFVSWWCFDCLVDARRGREVSERTRRRTGRSGQAGPGPSRERLWRPGSTISVTYFVVDAPLRAGYGEGVP